MKTTTIAAIGLALAALWSAPTFAQTAHDLMQQALVKEQAEGDLRGAIALYQRIAEEHVRERALVARALVQMGQCYEKLGSAEAQRAYQRVVQEFADQAEPVERARARLAVLQRPAATPAPGGIVTRRVWTGPNAGGAESPTPDGMHLVWTDDQETGNLAIRDMVTGNNRLLTHDARTAFPTAWTYGAKASPDGRWIAYGHGQEDPGRGSLRMVATDGTRQRELWSEPGCWIWPTGWTSDGAHILARSYCGPDARPRTPGNALVRVSAADGTLRVLDADPNANYLVSSLSPDGRYVAYGFEHPIHGAEEGGQSDIRLLPLGGGAEIDLIGHPANDRLLGWIPGTEHLLFLSDRDGTWDLWAARVRDGRLDGEPVKLQRDLGEIRPLGFSEDGSFFFSVFTRWFTTSLARVDPVTGTADMSSAEPLLGSVRHPQWGPHGRRLAYVVESDDDRWAGKLGTIRVRDLSSGRERELAPELGVRFLTDWSPDGRALLALGVDANTDDAGPFVVDVVSGGVRKLLDVPEGVPNPDGVGAIWDADGTGVIYSLLKLFSPRTPVRDEARYGRLVRRDLASGTERLLYTDSMLIPRLLALGPDGRRLVLAVEDTAGETATFRILDLETGSARDIVTVGDSLNLWSGSVAWSPDGRHVLYAAPVQGDGWRTHVWRVPAAGGTPEHLWKIGEGKWGAWFQPSPDGSRVALTTYTQEAEIWVMENLVAALRGEQDSEGSPAPRE